MAIVTVDTPNNPSFSNIERVTRISVKVKNTQGIFVTVGAIQSFNPSESRDVTPHFTLGGNAEIAKAMIPNIVRDKRLEITALAVWKNDLLTALGNNSGDPYFSLIEQTTGFQIQVAKEKADGSASVAITFEDCFVTNISATQDISRGDVTIIQNATVVFRKVTGSYADV
jgi:hypothetical protein